MNERTQVLKKNIQAKLKAADSDRTCCFIHSG